MELLGFGRFLLERLGVGCGFLGDNVEFFAFESLVFCSETFRTEVEGAVSLGGGGGGGGWGGGGGGEEWKRGRVSGTLEFGEVDAELIAFFQDALASFVDEIVESCCELGHAIAEVIKAEVYAREGVSH